MHFKSCVKWKDKLYTSGQKTRAKKELQNNFEKRARKTLGFENENLFVSDPAQISESHLFYALASEEVKYGKKSLFKTKFFRKNFNWQTKNVWGYLWGKM